MRKEDKVTLLRSILICIVSFLLAGYGYLLYLDGYGKTGAIRAELNNVVDKFNSLESVKSSAVKLTARYQNKAIVVNFQTDRTNIDYTFKYEELSGLKTIKLTYIDTDAGRAEEIAKNMIEAISVLAGNVEGDVFYRYNYENFYETSISQGVNLVDINGNVTVQIALHTDLLSNIEGMSFSEEKIPYITSEDLTDIYNQLETNSRFLYSKGNAMIYVVDKKKEYVIYSSDALNEETNIHKSAMAVIARLDSDVYNDILHAKISLSQTIERNNYKIELNPKTIDNNQMMNGAQVVKITITKK